MKATFTTILLFVSLLAGAQITNARINQDGKTIYINANGGITIYINANAESDPPVDPPEEDTTDWNNYLQFANIASDLELINSGKGIQQKAGTTNSFTVNRYAWGFNKLDFGDRLIWIINANPTYSSYVYLNESPYDWSNSNDEYAVNAQIGLGGQARIGMRDRLSAGVVVPTSTSYVSIAAGDTCAFLYNANGTVSLQKRVANAWSTVSTSNYTTSGYLYAGVKTFRPGSGVNEIYVNTPVFHDYPTPLAPKKGAIIGNSTMVGGTWSLNTTTVPAMAQMLYTVQEVLAGFTAVTLAVGGHTIPQQKTVFNAYTEKSTLDFVVIQLGLNNLFYLEGQTDAQDIAQLQDLVNTVNDSIPGVEIILMTMDPAKGRWYDVIWPTEPARAANAQASWTAINQAARGEGSTPITGVDAYVYQHTTDLDDGTGYLRDEYQFGDEIHTNGKGREVKRRAMRVAMEILGIISL